MFTTNSLLCLGILILLLCLSCDTVSCLQILLAVAFCATLSDCDFCPGERTTNTTTAVS